MICVAGITNLKLGRDVLGAEHCHHKSRIVKTNPLFALKRPVNIGKITGFYRRRQFFIIGNIFNHIKIHLLHKIQIAGGGA